MTTFNKRNLMTAVFGGILVATAAVSTASAGGFLADVARTLGVPKEYTDMADEAHRQFKDANPSYADAEEDFTNRQRKNLGLAPHCDPIFDKRGRQIGCQ